MRVLCSLTYEEAESFTVQNELISAYDTLLSIYRDELELSKIKHLQGIAIDECDAIIDKIYSKYIFSMVQGENAYVDFEKLQLYVP